MQEQSSAERQRGAVGERTGGINASLCSLAVPLVLNSHRGRDDVGCLHLLPASFPGCPAQRSGLSSSCPSLLLTSAAPARPVASRLQVSGHLRSEQALREITLLDGPPLLLSLSGGLWEAGRGKCKGFGFVIKKISPLEHYLTRCQGVRRCYISRNRGSSQQAKIWGVCSRSAHSPKSDFHS